MPKRTAFISIQLSHHVPCAVGEPSRIRTGYEKVLAHRSSSLFAVVAKQDGSVIDINDKLKIMTVKYKDGTTELIEYGPHQGVVDGIYLNQERTLNVKLGEKVKEGDVILYNPGFFSPELTTKQVNWKHGVHTNVMIIENDDTIEDSSVISTRLSKKLTMKPTELRSIKITNKTVIHEIVKVGDVVANTDRLCTIEDEDISNLSIANDISDEAFDLISSLNKKQPKAKFSGTIVDMNVHYSCSLESMHPSVAKLVKSIAEIKNTKATYAKGTSSEILYPRATQVAKGTKLKGIEFDDDTILIMFYICEDIACGVGDKVVLSSSLKSVLSGVMPSPLISESGVEIDMQFGANSINNRIVNSPIRAGIISRILEDAEKHIVDIFFENKD